MNSVEFSKIQRRWEIVSHLAHEVVEIFNRVENEEMSLDGALKCLERWRSLWLNEPCLADEINDIAYKEILGIYRRAIELIEAKKYGWTWDEDKAEWIKG